MQAYNIINYEKELIRLGVAKEIASVHAQAFLVIMQNEITTKSDLKGLELKMHNVMNGLIWKIPSISACLISVVALVMRFFG